MMRKPVAQNRIIAILVICICCMLLWLNHRFSIQVDVSGNARHSLSATTISTLELLPMPLEIIAITRPDPTKHQAITSLIEKLRQHKPDIALSFINPDLEPSRVRDLGGSSPGGELILRYQEREKRLNNLSERTFTEALQQLSRGGERTLAFVTGHGERAPDNQANDGYSIMANRLRQSGLNMIKLSLVTVPRIPDNIDGLVIAAPVHNFFPGEVASVLDYVSRGGNLLWLIDDSSLSGLKALSIELGVDLAPGIVIDAKSSAWGADSPTFVVVDQYPQHAVNQGLQSPVLLPQARALNVTPLAGQITTPLLQSGPESWTETGVIEGAIKFDPGSAEQRGPLTLAVTIERNRSGVDQRIIVAADADLFASTWIGNGANQEYASRLMNWLAADDSLVSFKTIEAVDSVVELTPRQTLFIGAGFLLLLPLLLLLTGTYQWYRQKYA